LGVIGPWFGAEAKVSAGERWAKLRDQFFCRIGAIPESLA